MVHLPQAEKPETATAIIEMVRAVDGAGCAGVLSDLCTHVSEDAQTTLMQEAISFARAEKRAGDRISARMTVAPRLQSEHQNEILSEALTCVLAIEENDERERLLGVYAKQFSPLPVYLRLAMNIEDDLMRCRAFEDIALDVPESLVGDAVGAAIGISEPEYRSRALAALLPRVGDFERRPLLDRALADARSIARGSERADALAAIVPHLQQSERFLAVLCG